MVTVAFWFSQQRKSSLYDSNCLACVYLMSVVCVCVQCDICHLNKQIKIPPADLNTDDIGAATATTTTRFQAAGVKPPTPLHVWPQAREDWVHWKEEWDDYALITFNMRFVEWPWDLKQGNSSGTSHLPRLLMAQVPCLSPMWRHCWRWWKLLWIGRWIRLMNTACFNLASRSRVKITGTSWTDQNNWHPWLWP